MARGSTVLQFEIGLSDIDRHVYEALSLKVAQHPSESGPHLVARVIAYALEFTEGLTFTSGLSSGDEPALWVRDMTGQLQAWIEIGTPEGPRLHKASKAADRVAVYCHKEPMSWLRLLERETVHGSEHIALAALPAAAIGAIAEGLTRRNSWTLSRIEDAVFIESDGKSHSFNIERLSWPGT